MKFDPLTEAETTWLKDQLRCATAFVGDASTDQLPPLTSLDEAFARFVALGDAANAEANGIVLCVGAAFGEHLVRDLGFQWGIATDDWGTDIAVLARPGRGDCTVYPTDFVAKRWERRETNFLVGSLEQISEMLDQYARDWRDA